MSWGHSLAFSIKQTNESWYKHCYILLGHMTHDQGSGNHYIESWTTSQVNWATILLPKFLRH
jgi:hypothetical protein